MYLRVVPIVALLALAACDKSGPKPSVTEGFNVLGHPNLSYVWVFPKDLTGDTILAPNGWTYWNEAGTVEGTAWIAPLPDRISQFRTFTREMIRDELDRFVHYMSLNAPFLAGSAPANFSFQLEQSRAGLDRLAAPVEIRTLDLQLDSLDELEPTFVLDWAARQMGGKATGANRGSQAGAYKIVLAMAPLISPFLEVAEDPDGRPLGFYAVWVAVPARLDTPEDFERIVMQFADVLPVASKFSSIAVTENELRQPDVERSIAVIAAVDPSTLNEDEQVRFRADLLETLANARPPGTELRVALIRSCDSAFVKNPGAEDFVSSFSASFDDEIGDRIDQLFEVSPLQCLANMMQRSAILAAQQSGADWEQADERWFFWLSKRREIANASLSNLNLPAQPQEYREALVAEKASIFAVGPAELFCNDADKTTLSYEPDVAKSFRNRVDDLGGVWFEFCEDWSAELGSTWASLTAAGVGLQLQGTPLPGTLTVYSGDVSLPEGGDFGYTLDRSSRVIVPGPSLTFGPDDVWRAEYLTLQEPDTSEF